MLLRIDGAGHTRFLVQVGLPKQGPNRYSSRSLPLYFNTWNDFLWPLLVTTRDIWRPLMVGLWTFSTEVGPQTQLMMAGAIIAIIPVLLLYFITQKQYTESIATSGLKR